MNVTVTVTNTIPEMFGRLRSRAPQAIVRATNRAAVSARTAMLPPMAQDLSLKQGIVKERVRMYEARVDRPVARLAASLKRIALYDFSAKGPVPSRGKGRGVTARMQGATHRYPEAFIATMRSGHVGVFQRKRTARLPIRELFGPSIGRVFIKFRALGRARAIEALQKNIQSEFRFALSRS